MSLKPVTASTLLLTALLSGHVLAQVPVVESRSVPGSSSNQRTPDPVATVQGNTSTAPASGAAHLLNLIDELRTEIMSLRGQVEEQGYQIRQLQQDNRDRYLDLDERISRLGPGDSAAREQEAINGDRASGDKIVPSYSQGVISPPSPLAVDPKAQQEQAAVQEKASYDRAIALVRAREFESALVALRQLLTDYPSGRYADNVQYWLGEVQMAQGHYQEARSDFQVVLSEYPGSAKVPDAAYKLGRLYDLLGDKATARKHLESVVNDYPGTAAARLSDTYLRSMPGS